MSIGKGYNLEPEEFEIINEAVINYLSNRKGIYNFLKKRGQVIDLEDGIHISNFSFSRDLEDREIGIKALPFYEYGIQIRNVALIEMNLKIDQELLYEWKKKGKLGMVLHELKIHNDIKRFLDHVEQFILRGTDTKLEFVINDIDKDINFNCFFHGHVKQKSISIHEFKDLHEAVGKLKHDLREKDYNPPFTLMSDSETLKWAKYKFPTGNRLISYRDKIKELNEIDKWIDLHGHADNSKSDDFNLVCIANKRYSNTPIKIVEKSPLNITNIYGGISLYWCGALEASDNAIQQIKLEF